MSDPITTFRNAQDAFFDAAVALGRAWDAVAADGHYFEDGYPFARSLNDMVLAIGAWRHRSIIEATAARTSHARRQPDGSVAQVKATPATYPVRRSDGRIVHVTIPPNEPRAAEGDDRFPCTNPECARFDCAVVPEGMHLLPENDTRRFTLDGEPIALAAFLRDNLDWFERVDMEGIENMSVGDEVVYGGGAAASSVLRRIA